MDIDREIDKEVNTVFGDNPPRAINATIKLALEEKLSAPVFELYDDVFATVSNGVDKDAVIKKFEAYPSEIVDEMYSKAVRDLKQMEGTPNRVKDDPTNITDESPSMTANKEKSMDTAIADTVGARIIEQLATRGDASLQYVAKQIGEDPVLVGQISNDLIRAGIISELGSGVCALSRSTNAHMSELVTDDGLSVFAAAKIVKESTDSPGEGVTPAEDVQDTVPDNLRDPNADQPDPGTKPITGPDGTTKIDTEESVQDTIQNDPSTVNTPDSGNPDPTGTGAGSDSGTDDIVPHDSVHDAVPQQSADTGTPPQEPSSELPGSGRNQ